MSYLIDSNLLLRLAQPKNPHQEDSRRALRTLRRQREILRIVPQNLIEFWAVATRPAVNNGLGLTLDECKNQIGRLKKMFVVLPDSPDIFPEWERIVDSYKVLGKQAHDARLVAAMNVHSLTHLLTFNDSDFKRFTEITVVNPHDVS